MEKISLHAILEIAEIKELLKKLTTLSDILKLYATDPYQVATLFVNGEYKALYSSETESSIKNAEEDFKDILKGINGDFTKSRAIEIGRQKISRYIEELLIEITAAHSELKALITLPISTLKSNIGIITANPFDVNAFERRKALYTGPLAAKEFMSKKLTQLIGNEIGTNIQNKLVLETFINIVKENCVIKDYSALNKYIEMYLAKISILKFKEEQVDKDSDAITKESDFDANTINDHTLSLAVIYDNYIVSNKNKAVEVTSEEATDLDLLGNLSLMVTTYTDKLQNDANNIETSVKSLLDSNDNFVLFLNNFKNNVLIPFTQTNTTAEEFANGVYKYIYLLDSSISLDKNIFVEIFKEAFVLNKSISTYTEIFTFVDKITTNGTIGITAK
jgi:hypothetical protein